FRLQKRRLSSSAVAAGGPARTARSAAHHGAQRGSWPLVQAPEETTLFISSGGGRPRPHGAQRRPSWRPAWVLASRSGSRRDDSLHQQWRRAAPPARRAAPLIMAPSMGLGLS